jgi:hypothetical protein
MSVKPGLPHKSDDELMGRLVTIRRELVELGSPIIEGECADVG